MGFHRFYIFMYVHTMYDKYQPINWAWLTESPNEKGKRKFKKRLSIFLLEVIMYCIVCLCSEPFTRTAHFLSKNYRVNRTGEASGCMGPPIYSIAR